MIVGIPAFPCHIGRAAGWELPARRPLGRLKWCVRAPCAVQELWITLSTLTADMRLRTGRKMLYSGSRMMFSEIKRGQAYEAMRANRQHRTTQSIVQAR